MAVNILKFVNTRVAKQEFTKLNRLVAEEKDMRIITKRGKPVTALISMDKLKELIGDEKFKELLYEFYTASVLEKDVQSLLSGKEKTIPFEEAKKKLGWQRVVCYLLYTTFIKAIGKDYKKRQSSEQTNEKKVHCSSSD